MSEALLLVVTAAGPPAQAVASATVDGARGPPVSEATALSGITSCLGQLTPSVKWPDRPQSPSWHTVGKPSIIHPHHPNRPNHHTVACPAQHGSSGVKAGLPGTTATALPLPTAASAHQTEGTLRGASPSAAQQRPTRGGDRDCTSMMTTMRRIGSGLSLSLSGGSGACSSASVSGSNRKVAAGIGGSVAAAAAATTGAPLGGPPSSWAAMLGGASGGGSQEGACGPLPKPAAVTFLAVPAAAVMKGTTDVNPTTTAALPLLSSPVPPPPPATASLSSASWAAMLGGGKHDSATLRGPPSVQGGDGGKQWQGHCRLPPVVAMPQRMPVTAKPLSDTIIAAVTPTPSPFLTDAAAALSSAPPSSAAAPGDSSRPSAASTGIPAGVAAELARLRAENCALK